MAVSTMQPGRTSWPATTKLLLAAFVWSALVLVAALALAVWDGFDVITAVGAAPMALWVSSAGWVAYGARTSARAPNLVPIALCGAFMLVAVASFIAPLLLAGYPTAVLIVVAAAHNLNRWPR